MIDDKQIIRELATDEKQQDANMRFKATNDLKLVRPPVLIDEIPWYQMNIGDAMPVKLCGINITVNKYLRNESL